MTQKDYSDNLSEQIVNIAKAGAFDIISKHRNELAEQNKNYRACLVNILKAISEMDVKLISTHPDLLISQISAQCQKTLSENKPT